MIAARVPLPIIAKIVGWAPGTMAKTAARYGNFGTENCAGRRKPSAATLRMEACLEQGPYNFHYTQNAIPGAAALTD